MKSLKLFTGCALACVAMSGCAALQGFNAVNTALVPQLKPIDARMHTDITCSDLASALLAASSGVPNAAPLSPQQIIALVKACENRDQSTTITIDPQGGRQALNSVVAKAAAAPAAVAAKAVGVP